MNQLNKTAIHKAEVEALIAQGLAALFAPGDHFEVRILGLDGHGKRVASGYFNDIALAAKALAAYDGRADGIYVTPNLINPALLARAANRIKPEPKATTSDHDILRRRWLLIDADPVRPAAISSTEEEHEAALQRIAALVEWLATQGWPPAILADSGNGGHALYALDLPNTPDASHLVEGILKALAAKFSDAAVKIDTTTANAARIWKVYGTLAGKGDNIAERPHRRSSVISVPEQRQIVPLALLEALAAEESSSGAEEVPQPSTRRGNAGDRTVNVEQWLALHGIAYQAKKPWHGGWLWTLAKCPFSDDHSDGAWVAQFPSGAIDAGCHHDRCRGQRWHELRQRVEGKPPASPKAQRWNASCAAPTPPAEDTAPELEAAGLLTAQSAQHKADLARLGYSFALNVLDDVIEVNGRCLDDNLAAVIRTQMRDLGHKQMGALEDTYIALAYANGYHPVRRFLDDLVWDGADHFGKLCAHVKDRHEPVVYLDKAGAIVARVPLFRVWLYRWMLAAVAKVYQPRVQNPVLVLDGAQGIGKSRLAAFLGSALPGLFIESPIHPDNKEHDRYLVIKFIWEIAELGATTRHADREALKAFLTKGDVTFRKPYGKHAITKPALANFIGTINNDAGFLTDPTGNRRFLTVTLESIDWRYERVVNVHQLWAQIVADYRQGQRWELRPEERARRDANNQDYERVDAVEQMILHHFEIDLRRNDWFMFTTEIASHLREQGARDSDYNLFTNIASAMRRLNVPNSLKYADGGRRRGYNGVRKKDLWNRQNSNGTDD